MISPMQEGGKREYNISGPGGNIYAVIGKAISRARQTWPGLQVLRLKSYSLMTGNGLVSPDAAFKFKLHHIKQLNIYLCYQNKFYKS